LRREDTDLGLACGENALAKHGGGGECGVCSGFHAQCLDIASKVVTLHQSLRELALQLDYFITPRAIGRVGSHASETVEGGVVDTYKKFQMK
jgi:hypothetical protein